MNNNRNAFGGKKEPIFHHEMVHLDGIELDLRKQLDGQTDSMKVLNIAYLHSKDL